jgi:hypothetical protein
MKTKLICLVTEQLQIQQIGNHQIKVNLNHAQQAILFVQLEIGELIIERDLKAYVPQFHLK